LQRLLLGRFYLTFERPEYAMLALKRRARQTFHESQQCSKANMSAWGQSRPSQASRNSGHARYAPKEESWLPVIRLCGLMATHTTSFPRSSLLKGGTVPRQKI
jgi:hypothetical protein